MLSAVAAERRGRGREAAVLVAERLSAAVAGGCADVSGWPVVTAAAAAALVVTAATDAAVPIPEAGVSVGVRLSHASAQNVYYFYFY